MRTAFICVTVTVTSPLERIYISAGVTRRPFGFQPNGWCLSRSGNRSVHFRRYFAMGKIRGTPYMRSHIFVHRATTKYFSNSFVFKTEIEKEGLPGDITPALGAGGPEFESRRPDHLLIPKEPESGRIIITRAAPGPHVPVRIDDGRFLGLGCYWCCTPD